MDGLALDALTAPQLRFATDVGATAPMQPGNAEGTVFVYRENELSTSRWLVDHTGRVLDTERFHKSFGDRR